MRAVRVVRPKYAVVENVAALLVRGMDVVLGDLAESGYDAEWDCIPAFAVGAPHARDRVWIVANADCVGQPGQVYGGKLRTSRREDAADSTVWSMPVAWPPGPSEVDSIPRMADGIPRQLLRTRVKESKNAIGNAVVPQIPELIGRAIMEAEFA